MNAPSPDQTSLPLSPERMATDNTGLLIIDLQSGFLKAQPAARRIVFNAQRLVEGARTLGVRVGATEQSPEKLGVTAPELSAWLPAAPSLKTEFRATACGELLLPWIEEGIEHFLLCGIETHICVQQTALDLLAAGVRVAIAVDAVGSRFTVDFEVALRRMESSGATLTTTEAVLFEWCRDAARPEFKAISAIAKRTLDDGDGS